jgi:hypothetical protein
VDFVVSIIQRYTSGGNGSIGYSAHIAGGVAGILIGMNVLRNFHHKVIFLRCKKSKISISLVSISRDILLCSVPIKESMEQLDFTSRLRKTWRLCNISFVILTNFHLTNFFA